MKKILKLIIRSDSDKLKKQWLGLKLTLLLLFTVFFNVNASLLSQNKVTLNLKGATLKDVIWEIERQTGIVFMYSSDDLNKVGKVDVELNSKSLDETLEKCLDGTGLTYALQDDVIVVKPAPQQDVTKKVSGEVKDSKGMTLPGVTVIIKGTTVGVATDINGKYAITLTGIPDPVLIFSSVGMKSKEVKVGTNEVINVVLEEDTQVLEEVVVAGYQTVHKRNVTGSISRVSGETLADIPAASVSEMLSGKVVGLQSLNTGGGPGSKNALVIRGNTVMSGNLGEANEFSDPLYVIDGVPTDLQSLAGYDVTNSD